MISWPEKNDTAMLVEGLAYQNLSFSDGGVIFILLHTFRDLRSLSKWAVTNFKYLCTELSWDTSSSDNNLCGHKSN